METNDKIDCMIAMCYIKFDTLKTIWCWRKRSNIKILGLKWSKHIVTCCLMGIAHSENLENFAVCTHRGTWCHQVVWSVCHWPEHCQGANACTSSIRKWTKVSYMLCSFKCLVTNTWTYKIPAGNGVNF